MPPPAASTKRIVLYDSDCAFCKWSLGKILAWDRRGALRPVAIQSPEGRELLTAAGVPEAELMDSWHLVVPTGEAASAGAAAPLLFEVLPGGAPIAALTRTFPKATERAYRWVAGNRNRLARLLRIDAGCELRA